MHIRKCVRLAMQNLKILYKTRLSGKILEACQPLFQQPQNLDTGKKPSEAGNSRYAGKKTARICKVSALEVSF